MKPSWKVRMYRPGDEKGIVELLNKVFGVSSKRDIELWLWEYKNNLFGNLEILAEHRKRLVGHMGLIGVELKVGDQVFTAAQAVDLAVHPDFRRQGMFLELGKCLMENASRKGVTIVYGIPNEPAYYGHLKYGWFYVSRIPVLAKFLNVGSLFRFLLIRNYYFMRRRYSPVSGQQSLQLLPFLRSILNWMRFALTSGEAAKGRAASNEELKIRQISAFDERFDNFWKDVSNKLTVAVERNSKYLNWRYFEKPSSCYKVLIAERAGSLLGYLVLASVKPWDWASLSLRKIGFIVDLVAKSREAADKLIHAAVRHLNQKHVDLMLCWMMKAYPTYECLVENGFHYDKTLQEMILMCRINVPINTQILDEIKKGRNWFLTAGDSDLI